MINDTHDHMVGYVGLYIYIPMGLYNVIFPKISLIVWNEIPYQWDYIRNVNGQPASKLDKRQDSDELVNG